MLLTELVLHNFGVYKGRQVVPLAPPSPDRPIVLVGGLNGAGKTTFLDALQLALYGHRARTSNRGALGYEEYLRRCISRSVPMEDGASLELTFEVDREGRPAVYRVRRQWSPQGSRVRERLDIWLDGEADEVLAANWSDHVEEIIPLEIASLFFFDGEKIEALADPERTQAVIKSAVHSLLGVGVVDRLTQDLVALKRRQKGSEPDTDLEARIAVLSTELEAAKEAEAHSTERVARASEELGFARIALGKIDAKLATNGGDLLARRYELEAQREAAAAQVKVVEDALRHLAADALPLVLVQDLLADATNQAKAERESEKQVMLQAVLADRDSQLLEDLQKQLKPGVISMIEQAMRDDRDGRVVAHTERVLDLSDEAFTALLASSEAVTRDRKALKSEMKALAKAQDALATSDRTLAAIPAADSVADLIAEREEAKAAALLAEGRLAALKEDRDRAVRAKEDVILKHDRALAVRVEHALRSEDTARLIEHAERAQQTLSTYRARLLARHIGKLEVAVLESLRHLMRKGHLVHDLRIDLESFEVHLLGTDGHALRAERLSAGERQMLAVAVLWGLARVAGHRLPTIIDTPLGRLDGVHRKHLVTRYFPHASRQVLLLSTDKEIDAHLRALLMRSVGHSYLIEHDDKQDCSVIGTGYFWQESEHVA